MLATLQSDPGSRVAPPARPGKAQLRLFTTFETESASRGSSPSGQKSAKAQASPAARGGGLVEAEEATSPPHAEGSSRWGLYRQLTGSLPLPLSLLLLRTLSPCHELDLAFRDHLFPRWRLVSWAFPCLKAQCRMWVEQPCVGVPGLVNYVGARSRWLDLQINAACRTEAVTQAVVLRSGLDSRACRLRLPGLQFYEVDDREALAQKRALLDAVLPDRAAHPRPRFVAVAWDNIKSLIPALTAEGFDPMQRSVFIMEGTLPHLTPAQVDALLEDVTALAAPGSRLCFDFLHQDALEGAVHPAGYANLAEAAANKGAPLLSGMRPAYSGLVRRLQPYHLRVTEVLPAAQVAKQLLPGAAPARGGCLAPRQLLPEFFSLVVATKANPRLLLRNAPTTMATEGGELAAFAAAAARSRPPCLSRGLAFLFGWGAAPAPAPAAAAAAAAEAAAAAAPVALAPPPPVVERYPSSPTLGGGGALPAVASERSADWTLDTTVAGGPAAAASTAGRGDGVPELQAAAAALNLDRAQSIAALPAGAALRPRGGSEEGEGESDESGPLSWWHQYAHLQ